jgi:hypothetical protein
MVAQYLKRKNNKQGSIVAASLYGINEVYGLATTAPLVWELVSEIIKTLLRGKHGKSSK